MYSVSVQAHRLCDRSIALFALEAVLVNHDTEDHNYMMRLQSLGESTKLATSAREKKHISQSQVELRALYRVYRSTGGATKEQLTSGSWKQHTGWIALEQAVKHPVENVLARGSMENQFPLFGVTWERNHVVAIDLSANGLSGRIPSDIAHLRSLKTLKLRNNTQLQGTIPEEMYTMTHLRYCYLDGTGLEKALPCQLAHSFQITQFHHASSPAAATICYLTTSPHGHDVRWTADITDAEMFMMHTSLKALRERPKPSEVAIEVNGWNATGPERTAAATKLQRIYRARIERTKFKTYLKSLFQRCIDATSGLEYFVDSRTGEAAWERPAFVAPAQLEHRSDSNDVESQDAASEWQPCDDGNGNTVRTLKGVSVVVIPLQSELLRPTSHTAIGVDRPAVLLEQRHWRVDVGTASLPLAHLPGAQGAVWRRQVRRRTLRALLPRHRQRQHGRDQQERVRSALWRARHGHVEQADRPCI